MATKLRANQINIQDVVTDPAAQATDTSKGTLRIATQAEVNGGSPYDNTIVVTPETLSKASIITDHTSALNPHNNWMSVNNDAAVITGNISNANGVSIGNDNDSSLATGGKSVLVGNGITAAAGGGNGIGIGVNCEVTDSRQIVIGNNIDSTSVTTDTINSVKIGGWGEAGANLTMMHLMHRGKLELYGTEAQYIFPNYEPVGSPATLPVPTTTIEGGTVYSIDEKTLKFYNGTAWTALNANNWLHANNGSDFGTAPVGTGTDSIALGNSASTGTAYGAVAVGTNVTAAINAVSIGADSDALGTSSVAIGKSAQTTASGTGVAIGVNTSAAGSSSIAIGQSSSTLGQRSIAMGFDSDTSLTHQIAIGNKCKDTSVGVDTTYSVKLGEGEATANKNMLHLFSQGKLELYGEAAQFVMPSYVMGSPAVEPATATEGGVIYDSTAQGLKFYNGAAWSPISGASNNWLIANNGADFAIAPTATGTRAITIGNNATGGSTDGISIGSNAQVTGILGTAVGNNSIAQVGAVAVGTGAQANVNAGVAVGINSDALADNAISMGRESNATSGSDIAIGEYATTGTGTNNRSVIIGRNSATGNGTVNGIAIGNNATIGASGSNSVVVGANSTTPSDSCVVIGAGSTASTFNQTIIGPAITSADVTADVAYSLKAGCGTTGQINLLHLHTKGKLELVGDSAQFVMPNWANAGSPLVDLPATATEGGVIYDSTAQGLKFYNGAAWSAVGGAGGTPGGADTEMQYNNGGSFGGISEFTYNDATGELFMAKTGIGSNDAILHITSTTGGNFSYGLDVTVSGTSTQTGVRGVSSGNTGRGVWGETSGSGASKAIYGHTSSATGTGVHGECNSATGANIGVFGKVLSADGIAGQFENFDGTNTEVSLASATDFITCTLDSVEKFRIDDAGNAEAAGNVISHIAINVQVGTEYTLVLADDGKLVTMTNAGANDLIIPLNASVAFPIGTQILVEQNGAGQTTIAAGGSPPSVTINSSGGFTDLANQYTTVTLIKKSTDTWLLIGDLV